MKFSKYTIKAVTPVMALFQKQHQLPFKQGYDNLRSTRGESAASADTAQSERCFHRNQSAACASHNVPSDTIAHHKLQFGRASYYICNPISFRYSFAFSQSDTIPDCASKQNGNICQSSLPHAPTNNNCSK